MAWYKRPRPNRWIDEIEQNVEPGAEIGMEACGGVHHWGRLLQSKSHVVRLIAPQFVKPYVKSNKPDANDAHAALLIRLVQRYPDIVRHLAEI